MDITNTNAPQRVAIVTGGSGGIGRVTAERLARDGMAVVVHYAGNKARADETVEAITKAGGTAMSAQGDVANEQAMADMFSAATQAYGGVDVVVNTAGLMILAPVVDFKLEDLDRMHRTNIRGTFVVSQLAAQQVRRGGAIINFSTSVVELALPTYAAYSSSKGAVEALTPILAKELGSKDITVNAVAPGPTATPLFLDGKDQATIDKMAAMNPLKRLGQPEDAAEVVAFLAGPGCWVNGQTIYANGGMI